MSKKLNIANNVISLALTVGLVFLVAVLNNVYYDDASLGLTLVFFLTGAVVSAVANAFLHETGHILAAKKLGFEFVRMNMWFFTVSKKNGRLDWNWTRLSDSPCNTEFVPKTDEMLKERYVKITRGGYIMNCALAVIGIAPLFLGAVLPYWAYCLLSVFLPVSVYYVTSNALPMTSGGVKNDGAVLCDLKKDTDSAKVMISLLKIHNELYRGKTPSEIDKELYFDLPQLACDDPNYAVLMNNRLNYYLDANDSDGAIDVLRRVHSFLDEIPPVYKDAVLADELYASCVIKRDFELADDLMEDLDKYLNGDNSLTNVRIKAAYAALVLKDAELTEKLFRRGETEIARCEIRGVARFEKKLFDRIRALTQAAAESAAEDK